MIGAAFGLAGGLFQTMLRNPLASPDVIGISYGASAAAVTAIVVFGASGAVVSHAPSPVHWVSPRSSTASLAAGLWGRAAGTAATRPAAG